MFDVIGKRNWFFAFSLLILIPGAIAILLTPITNGKAGLKFSIDYTGGTVWEFAFANKDVTPDQVKQVLVDAKLGEAEVTSLGDGVLRMRTNRTDLLPPATLAPVASPSASGSAAASASPAPSASASAGASASASPGASASASAGASESASPAASASASASPAASASASASPTPSPTPTPAPTQAVVIKNSQTSCSAPAQLPTGGELLEVTKALQAKFGPIVCTGQESTVGAIVSGQLIQNAFILIIIGALGILAWITVRFHDYKMGVTAVIALVHDVIVVVGIFAILGTIFNVEVDALFVTAMLTVIGFSVHDTIVVFDRIRENKARHAGEPFDAIVNHSILQTFGRSINTSFTVVLTLSALFVFGSATIKYFVLALLIGIISGTYSSIFNASPLLVVWTLWENRRNAAKLAATRSGRTPRRANA